MDERIQKAIEIAVRYGQIDGDHHKAWVIDQMVRELTGCPSVEQTFNEGTANEFTVEVLGESAEYADLIRNACDGEDGPATYSWDTGIAP